MSALARIEAREAITAPASEFVAEIRASAQAMKDVSRPYTADVLDRASSLIEQLSVDRARLEKQVGELTVALNTAEGENSLCR